MNEVLNYDDMVKELSKHKKQSLVYMLLGAMMKLQIAMRALRILRRYEFNPDDKALVELALKKLEE